MTSTSELHRKGNPRLVNAIAETYKGILNREIDANKEILITSGAYASLFYCHQGFIHKGDEVIFFLIALIILVSLCPTVLHFIVNETVTGFTVFDNQLNQHNLC